MAAHSVLLTLPPPKLRGTTPFEHLLSQRRSWRRFADSQLPLAELGQLLWAAQGISHFEGLRTAPSAGALYPLELYVVVGAVAELEAGIYRYLPLGHQLERTALGDWRNRLALAVLGQNWLAAAATTIVFTAVFERTSRKYGSRAARYVHMEAGHAAQNLYLQAEALALGTVVLGAFDDDEVVSILELPADTTPLILMPAGVKG